ncbi:uncharacterized protein LOC125221671 isoform X2 [Salvia hispanica]|uniref:uncharacterized protein LOC125221671 isoform X2 n=1 Tax=Salvia hispanica TaxID=49212 RepID=UPI002009C40D|nr:uncharacterized protein LOC125221671 isoform X2 [Salvia hispanica]XP_047979825.1 uncharacterized protein LOC125221671 isoform X2 [Salvia hispanica]XP_047979826.1 uncharacterized protein LOC125221671 isoform X2 [Salvia hispanica]
MKRSWGGSLSVSIRWQFWFSCLVPFGLFLSLYFVRQCGCRYGCFFLHPVTEDWHPVVPCRLQWIDLSKVQHLLGLVIMLSYGVQVCMSTFSHFQQCFEVVDYGGLVVGRCGGLLWLTESCG